MRFRGAYAFLSNFHPSPLTYEGIEYPTAEHAYQAGKTTESHLRVHISTLKTPGEAKRQGRYVKLRDNWETVKLKVMHDVLQAKFKNVALRAMLADTYPMRLVEDNTWGDTFWGVYEGHGENHLGIILMSIRAEIRAEHRKVRNAG
jgi:ribA/ribD-fused uncharacterized protein